MEEHTKEIIIKLLAGIFIIVVIMICAAIKISDGKIIPSTINAWENSKLILGAITSALMITSIWLYTRNTPTKHAHRRTT